MAKFDWKRFCIGQSIHFVTHGPNTSKNNISISCPYCGDDPSEHLGLSLNTNSPTYGCWRNQKHRGHNPAFLVAKLLSCTITQAERIVTAQGQNPDEFEGMLSALQSPVKEEPTPVKRSLSFPKEFREFEFPARFEAQYYFTDYLHRRGFLNVQEVAQHFRLHWAITEDYRNRVIIPVMEDEFLVSWTARAINKIVNIRYKSLKAEESVVNIKHSLLYCPWRTADTLIISEGPFDAIKLETYGEGVNATCVFGLTLSEQQMVKLSRLSQKYLKLVVMLDSSARAESDIMVSQLSELTGKRIINAQLPKGSKDPGALLPQQVRDLTSRL